MVIKFYIYIYIAGLDPEGYVVVSDTASNFVLIHYSNLYIEPICTINNHSIYKGDTVVCGTASAKVKRVVIENNAVSWISC